MAAARNNLTRRAVLGAAFAAPAFLGTGAGASAGNRRDWDAARALLGRAEAGLVAYRDGEVYAADQAFNAALAPWPLGYDFSADPEAEAAAQAAFAAYQPFEDRLNDLECAHLDAIRRLLRVPAPDLSALATKIELVVDYEVGTLEGGEECMAALKEDAMRLAETGADTVRRLW